MNPSHQVVVAGLLWAVALWRLPSATNSRKQRMLWAAFAALAVAMTFEIPSTVRAVDGTTGVNSLANLVKHLFGVVAAGAVLEFVIAVVRPEGFLSRRVRHTLTVSALAALTTFFALSPRLQETDAFFEDYDGSAFPALYMTVFTLYIGMAMTVATWLFLGSSRAARGAWLRSGLRLLGAGTAVGIAYAVQRAVFLVMLTLGHDQLDTKGSEDSLSVLLKTVSILLILLGSCLPPISVLVRAARDWRSLRRLEPLWRGLTSAVPHVVLKAPIHRRRFSLRLHRRIIEIGDASLTLREYVPASLQQTALETAEAAGLTGEQRDAAAEACWLAAASERALAGCRPLQGVPYPIPSGTDMDTDRELRWLSLVNTAYRDCPLVRSFVRTHAALPPQQEAA
ncbi:hypothetical protein LO771_23240 [Streptacidiphilus sp. ASG 303]|uniref:MAB_1171c family putative transporter n=1 Tax=Streptacidiphilus sp. ASG 303 TaxID=2896847 RepID=UPI001E502DA2|nr:MAB_1171c family putative transporter [Streptacidiphilus sp. ASG 303]MCD0485219.1 hypothetical protein [Streptacidiphilus sp. ASG 303]